jgi:DNA-binding NarL/FixJ family response regulator
MQTQGLNLFIVDDNKLMVETLKQYLQSKFGLDIRISTFNDGDSCLSKVDKDTNVVILDYFMKGKNGLEVLKEIKVINPKTEVIMLSNNENMALAIEMFRAVATDYVVKGSNSWSKISNLVNHIVTAPIRLMVDEFRLSKYMAVFLLTFVTMGIVVVIALQFVNR